MPGTTGTPAAIAPSRAAVLLPISRMAFARRADERQTGVVQAAANSAFSARNP